MFFVAFQPSAFQSNAFQEGYGGTLGPTLHRDGGEEGYKKHKRLEVKPEKLEFRDSDRRLRLRAAIEAHFAEPVVAQVVKPYTRLGRNNAVKINWAQVYENLEGMERALAAAQREIDDEDDILSIM